MNHPKYDINLNNDKIDILVNNAGIIKTSLFLMTSESDLKEVKDSMKDIKNIKDNFDPSKDIKKELNSIKESTNIFENEIKNVQSIDSKKNQDKNE